MQTETILSLAALALALYCLLRLHRASGEEARRGASALLARIALSALAVSAALCAAYTALPTVPADVQNALRLAHNVCHAAFFVLFSVWTIGEVRRGTRFERIVLAAAVLAAALGAIVEAVWSVEVAPFFGAAAALACLLLVERGPDPGRGGRAGVLLMVALTFFAVIAMDVAVLARLSRTQSEELGNTQLEVIRRDLEETIFDAESALLRTALGAEQLLDTGAEKETLAAYFDAQRESYLSNESFMNVYIAGPDWHIVPAFDAPEGFHAAERVWYLGAIERPGEVFLSEPYLDADTGAMCFTVSALLHDGETVVGMDLNFSKAQESISRMTRGDERAAMIVTSGGVIAGYTDMSLVGERLEDKLPEYAEVWRRVAASQSHGSFRTELDGRQCMVFSSETENGWHLILSVDTGALYGESYRQIAMLASVNLLMLGLVVLFWLLGEGEDPAALVGRIGDAGAELGALAGELSAHAQLLETRTGREQARERAMEAPSRRVLGGVVAAMLVSLAIVLAFCIRISVNWGNARLDREADRYENQLDEWVAQQRGILCMFTDAISVQPELMDDYDAAVSWLSRMASHYPEISACYMANPYAEHSVIMDNGWEPGEDERPETRPWYRATERAPEGFNVSAPYLDAQTGNYCITLSRVVYGERGDFLGIFGVDFFLDKLIGVLGESYTSRSYAFLVDSDGVIINHLNKAYEMGPDGGVSIEDTEYAEAYHRDGATTLRDWAGRPMACRSRRADSGFTVVVASRWWSIYGSTVVVTAVFVALFLLCLAFIVSLIRRLIRWQADANRRLVAAAEAAESANRAKSQFLSQMSHEIRTPMNAIIGLDVLALRDPDLPAHKREQLEKINASAHHLLSLINDILDMSRIESGRMTLSENVFSLRDFLGQIAVMVGGQCQEKGLRFEQHTVGFDEGTDVRFLGDDLKLKQVLINILGNAVKFTDVPGLVEFTAEQLARTDEESTLRFTMRDTGAGMDAEFLPHLFEAFSQGEGAVANRYGGTGLGMAITKNIVDLMGGEIGVRSEKGVGSVFTVTLTLPRAPEDAPAAAPAAAGDAAADDAADGADDTQAVSLAGRHVLIAEDVAQNAEILIDLLDLEKVTSEWAENGALAVQRFAESEPGHFDAILMDMRMPVMDGLAAARAIRALERPDAAAVPIVALTANAFEEDVRQCIDAGMNAHLSKPVDMDLLTQTLRRLLR